mgnify:CR=1 FL=1
MIKTKKKAVKKETKSSKLSDSEQVSAYMNESKHILKNELEIVRNIILGADKKITEHIKWNAPSFCFNCEDRITFNLSKKDCIQLIFHRGAKVKEVKGDKPILDDATGLLTWVSNDRAIAKFFSAQEINEKKEKLKKIVKQWIKITSE